MMAKESNLENLIPISESEIKREETEPDQMPSFEMDSAYIEDGIKQEIEIDIPIPAADSEPPLAKRRLDGVESCSSIMSEKSKSKSEKKKEKINDLKKQLATVQLRFTEEVLKDCISLQDDLDKEIPKTKTGPFLCSFCEKIFNQKSNQGQHIKRVHLKLSSKCEKCGKKLSFYKLNRHMKNIHKIAKKHKAKNPKDFICKVCENTFSTKFNLKQHIQSTHIGEKHTCKHCSKSFGTKRSLVRHNKIIHGGVKIKCKICEMTFNQVCNMKRHFYTFHN